MYTINIEKSRIFGVFQNRQWAGFIHGTPRAILPPRHKDTNSNFQLSIVNFQLSVPARHRLRLRQVSDSPEFRNSETGTRKQAGRGAFVAGWTITFWKDLLILLYDVRFSSLTPTFCDFFLTSGVFWNIRVQSGQRRNQIWTQPALARRVHRALRLTKARSGPGMNADSQDFKYKEPAAKPEVKRKAFDNLRK